MLFILILNLFNLVSENNEHQSNAMCSKSINYNLGCRNQNTLSFFIKEFGKYLTQSLTCNSIIQISNKKAEQFSIILKISKADITEFIIKLWNSIYALIMHNGILLMHIFIDTDILRRTSLLCVQPMFDHRSQTFLNQVSIIWIVSFLLSSETI